MITRTIQAVLTLMLAGVLASPSWAQETGRPGGPSSAPPVMEELDRMAVPERGGKDVEEDRKSTRLNSSHIQKSRMPSSA